MNYLRLILWFWHLNAIKRFSASATRLYFYYVQHCNQLHWTNPFTLADAHLCGLLGMAKNTMRPGRAELVAAGMITYQAGGNGRGDAAVYTLLDVPGIGQKKGANSAPFASVKEAVSAPLKPPKGSVKGANSDPYLYSIENKTCSKPENKEEEEASSSSALADELTVERVSVKKNSPWTTRPDAGAAHTRGGGAAALR